MIRAVHMQAVLSTWDAVQVELQGRYSLPRLREILAYGQESSTLSSLLTLLLTPLPGLQLLIFMDALPLNRPDAGIHHQTMSVYFRVFMCGWVMAFMMAMQLHQSSPTLPLSTTRLWAMSVLIGLIIALGLYLAGLSIGFPTPFVAQLLTPVWIISFTTCLWISWKDALRSDAEAKANLMRYIKVFLAQCAIILAYTIYGIIFSNVGAGLQTWVSLLLPMMKTLFKNWVSKGVYHMEDLAPSTIVFNVDVFHGMFVASTMQKSQTSGTTVVVMLVDVTQSCIAYFEIHKVLVRVNRLATNCHKFDRSFDSRRKSAVAVDARRISRVKLKLGVIDYALHVIETRPRIQNHPDVSLPRHLRINTYPYSVSRVQSTDIQAQIGPPRIMPLNSPATAEESVPQQETMDPDRASHPPASPRAATGSQPNQSQTVKAEQTMLECVKCVLKMLHMIESYLLIEFVEVIIAGIYTVYMWVLSHLSNRQYYSHLKGKSHDEILAMVSRLAIYTSLELLSFVVFCVVIDRKLRHISSIQILAFVLRKHVRMVQTTLVMWVFFVVQLTFEHFGTDYSFQFKWLRNAQPSSG